MRKNTLYEEFRSQTSDGKLDYDELNFSLINELSRNNTVSDESFETVLNLLSREDFLKSEGMYFILSCFWNDGAPCSTKQLKALRHTIEGIDAYLISFDNRYVLVDAIVNFFGTSDARSILVYLNGNPDMQEAVRYGMLELDR